MLTKHAGKSPVDLQLLGALINHEDCAGKQNEGVQRQSFLSSPTASFDDEVPGAFGKWNNEMIGEDLKPYRRAADIT